MSGDLSSSKKSFKESKTRSWFEPSSSSSALSATNPGSSSSGNLKSMWHENPLSSSDPHASSSTGPTSPTKKTWQESPFSFTTVSTQLPSTRATSPSRRRPTFPTPLVTTPPFSLSGSPSPSPSPSGQIPPSMFEDIFGITHGIYSRSLSKLSVSKDLPRFCPNIRVYKNHDLVMSPTNATGAASQILDIKNFLVTLLKYLDPPELVKMFEDNFSKIVTEDLDVATRLQAFFQSDVLPASCNTFAVLRCIHQEIIFPVVMKLRQTIYETFPYKDVKGSWNIYVMLVETKSEKGECVKTVGKNIKEVRVFHTKKEQSHDPNPTGHFEFEWAMALTLAPPFDEDTLDSPTNATSSPKPISAPPPLSSSGSSTNLKNSGNIENVHKSGILLQSSDFWVIDYWINEGFDKTAKPMLMTLLQKNFHPNTATMCLWSKNDIFQVNVSRDFPRLAVKTTVIDADKQVNLFSPGAVNSDKDPALLILFILTERLTPEYLAGVKKAYETHVEKVGDKIEFSVKFSNFMHSLLADKILPEDCVLVKVLKCITNEIIYPSAMALREQIYTDFPYKDVRNSRRVLISISDRKKQVKISHCKSEQTNDSTIEFEWQVTFTISKLGSKNLFGSIWFVKQGNYASVKSRLQIDRFVLSETIPHSMKIRFRELVHSLAAGRAEKQGVPIPALDFLQTILQSIGIGAESDIPVRLPKVAKTVPLHTALHYLANALAKVPFELPPVVVPKNKTDSIDISLLKRNGGEWLPTP